MIQYENQFQEVLQNSNYLLEMMLSNENFKFRLTIKKPLKDVGVFFGELSNLQKYRLIEAYGDLQKVMSFFEEPKHFKVDKSKRFVLLLVPSEKNKTHQNYKVSLKRNEIGQNLSLTKQKVKKTKMEWLNKDSCDYEKIMFKDNEITALSKAYVFGLHNLNGSFMFSVKVKCIKFGLAIGIADARNTKKGYLDDYYICLTSKGQLCASHRIIENDDEGKSKFFAGDTVVVIGNIDKKIIKFFINENLVSSFSFNKINKTIKWVPYFHLFEGCSLNLLENFPEVNVLPVYLAESWYEWDFDLLYELKLIQLMAFEDDGKKEE